MKETTKLKTLAPQACSECADFFILDALGNMVKLFYTEALDYTSFNPPLTVYTWDQAAAGWTCFELARVKDLFLEHVDG